VEILTRYKAFKPALKSAPIRALYAWLKAFEGGDIRKPRLAAGTGLRAVLRCLLTYKGAVFWRMNAGPGECVFVPYYKLLKHRGVKFEFFHKIRDVRVEDDRISSVELTRQMRVKKEIAEYSPLRRVGNLDCWPDRPIYSQLRKGSKLEKCGADLESFWNEWQFMGHEKRVILKADRDFDAVLLDSSPAANPSAYRELDRQKSWRRMRRSQASVETYLVRLWPMLNTEELGWSHGPALVSVGGDLTWIDMSSQLDVERWDLPRPESVATLSGVLEDAPGVPGPHARDFPQQQHARVLTLIRRWLDAKAFQVWPDAAEPGAFDEFILKVVAAEGEPLEQQYFHVSADPDSRFILTLPGACRHRLSADGSGFRNLFLAGDWVKTDLNLGGAEAATQAGLAAARGIIEYGREFTTGDRLHNV
jgi:uncharacterized protein with NAD-binding domain and iron-sulfur cluster